MLGLILAAAASVTAPASSAPSNPCQPAISCRYVADISLHDDKDVERKRTINAWTPFKTKEGRLLLFPGEMVTLKLEKNGDFSVIAFSRPDRVPVDEKTRQAITGRAREDVLLSAEPDGVMKAKDGEIMVFFGQLEHARQSLIRIENGYGQALSYKAFLSNVDGEYKPTSVCPLRPKGAAFEGWDYPNEVILLSNFMLTDRGADRVILAECDNGAS